MLTCAIPATSCIEGTGSAKAATSSARGAKSKKSRGGGKKQHKGKGVHKAKGTSVPEKEASSWWPNCCRRKKSVAVAAGKDLDDVLDKDSFLRRPKAIFALLTMLAISFGTCYTYSSEVYRQPFPYEPCYS